MSRPCSSISSAVSTGIFLILTCSNQKFSKASQDNCVNATVKMFPVDKILGYWIYVETIWIPTKSFVLISEDIGSQNNIRKMTSCDGYITYSSIFPCKRETPVLALVLPRICTNVANAAVSHFLPQNLLLLWTVLWIHAWVWTRYTNRPHNAKKAISTS